MKKQLEHFAKTFEGQLQYDSLHKTIYATDASVYRKMPLAVAYPLGTKGIQQLVQFASENKTSLIPRAAGTSLAGQCVGDGIVVDVSKHFTQIINLDLRTKTVTVQPGIIRDELNKFLKPHGLFFGPNTSTSNRCMIGGMVGNNSSGTTSIQYGVTRDKVLALDVVLSDGSVVTFEEISSEMFHTKAQLESIEGAVYSAIFSQLKSKEVQNGIRSKFPKKSIHRRNTGYAIDDLLDAAVLGGTTPFNMCKILAGSEGTLGLTTAITLSLDELPPAHTAMMVTHYNSLQDCLNDVVHAMTQELYTCEMMDKVILDRTKKNALYNEYRNFINGDPEVLLLLEVKANNETELEEKLKALEKVLNTSVLSYHNVILLNDEIDKALELRKAGLGLLGNMIGDTRAVACIEDTAVALEDLPAYIEEFTAIMDSYNQKAVYYAHAGAGELHLRPILNLKTTKGVQLFTAITADVAALVKKYKGSFSGEHGDGIVRSSFIPLLIGEENYSILKEIKKAFDPNNIFNPGKIVEAVKMDENFRNEVSKETPVFNTLLNFDDSQGLVRLAEKCNGSGDCRKSAEAPGAMCPSYHATKDEKDTTRARANMLREALNNPEKTNAFDNEDLKQVFDLCISCKACARECPSNVDMATAKAEFLYQYQKVNGVSRASKLFGKSSDYNKLVSKFPAITNSLFKNPFASNLIKSFAGVAQERSLPALQVFRKRHTRTENVEGKPVYLFVDEFSKYLDGAIAEDAVMLLSSLGYNVLVVDHLDSARALISKGFLEEAKIKVDECLDYFKDKISTKIPLLGIEPSAILGFRDEFKRLATDTALAKSISHSSFLLEEFLVSEFEKGAILKKQFTSEKQAIKIHVHCHQKSLSNQKISFDFLNIPENYSPSLITSGCCGMAGSFGYEKEHYKISMDIGELRLFPSVRKAPKATIISANGTSCRHQIKDGTNKEALHPITILRRALVC
jgi:FAD/FMN-containing dehydrogenase/Fe-S oxidoreductase